MDEVEEIDERGVPALEDLNAQVAHEPRERHPEIVPHHDKALDAIAIALPQRAGQFRLPFLVPGMQPLLELVDHDHDLLIGAQAVPLTKCGDRLREVEAGVQSRQLFPQPVQDAGLGLMRCSLNVDRDHPPCEAGEEAGLDQRRLAAAAGPVDHAHREAWIVAALDPVLPEPDAFGQALLVAWAGQKLEEEVAVVAVERAQPLGNNGNSVIRGRPVAFRLAWPRLPLASDAARRLGPANRAVRPRCTT